MRNHAHFWFFVSRSTISSFTNSMLKQKESMLKTIVNRTRNVATFVVVMKSRRNEIFVVTLNSRKKIFKTRDLKNKTKKFVCKIIVFEKSWNAIVRCIFYDKFEIDTWTSSNKFAWLCVKIAFELSRSWSQSRLWIMIEFNLILSNDDTKRNWLICENRNSMKKYFYRKTISRFNDKNIIIEVKSREYTRKNDLN